MLSRQVNVKYFIDSESDKAVVYWMIANNNDDDEDYVHSLQSTKDESNTCKYRKSIFLFYSYMKTFIRIIVTLNNDKQFD